MNSSRQDLDGTLPSNNKKDFWIYESKSGTGKNEDGDGKWMLFYDNSIMDEKWECAKQMYNEDKLNGVLCMKCSTSRRSTRASTDTEGVIIFYCNVLSSNENEIMDIGRAILNNVGCVWKKYIYYKTDIQTSAGTKATGVLKNSTYKLYNPNYEGPFKSYNPNYDKYFKLPFVSPFP